MARSNQFDKAFATLMLGMGETFNEPVSDVRIDLYSQALEDLPERELLAAMKACIAEYEFFPRPAAIRDRVKGPAADRAELAWGDVLNAVRRFGYASFPAHLEGPTMDAVRASWGSWSRLCEVLPSEGPELLGWRKVFLANYGAVERVAVRDGRSRELPAGVREMLADVEAKRALR